ncbi:MarR family winged helix-turn-helix transcriptional regulator [Yinghuangia soli]|uniref:MarR family transcriptional regulator n=1 Tax=Yinghuangia soli TaxID=2908204 RepID=A0AA41TXY6_9ACTN|nr:MarR family transcriptional regulator [Yinghuangia soli]MCF2527308.1 MarR family transcriptional regulator [Yinghuangia soli]
MASRREGHVPGAYFTQLAAERPDIALCRAAAAVARAGDAFAERRGYLVGQHLVLKMLDAVGPRSQQVLAEELRIDRSVMVGLCEELERNGHVRRERNPEDRRAYAVTITDAGRTALAVLERDVPDYLAEALAPLTAKERTQLAALLGKLLATG